MGAHRPEEASAHRPAQTAPPRGRLTLGHHAATKGTRVTLSDAAGTDAAA